MSHSADELTRKLLSLDTVLRSQKWPKTGRLAAGFRKGSIWDSPGSERAQIPAYPSQTETPFARTARSLSARKGRENPQHCSRRLRGSIVKGRPNISPK